MLPIPLHFIANISQWPSHTHTHPEISRGHTHTHTHTHTTGDQQRTHTYTHTAADPQMRTKFLGHQYEREDPHWHTQPHTRKVRSHKEVKVANDASPASRLSHHGKPASTVAPASSPAPGASRGSPQISRYLRRPSRWFRLARNFTAVGGCLRDRLAFWEL